jgi:hypothetical protein
MKINIVKNILSDNLLKKYTFIKISINELINTNNLNESKISLCSILINQYRYSLDAYLGSLYKRR